MSISRRAKERRIIKYLKQGRRCYWCGQLMTLNLDENRQPLPNTVTLDHIVPRSEGGTGLDNNVVGACYTCNQDRGGTTNDH